MRKWRRREVVILICVGLMVLYLAVSGILKMFFHQDDIDYLIVISKYWPEALWHRANEHVVVMFWLLYRAEWLVFGTNFSGFLFVNIILHLINLFLAGKLVYEETKSRFYGLLTALFLVVNNNWNESVWWSTGQMWLLATLFCLFFLLERKKTGGFIRKIWLTVLLVLPGISWGVGLLWPVIVFVGFGLRKRGNGVRVTAVGYLAMVAQLVLALVYRAIFVSIIKPVSPFSLTRVFQSVSFVLVGLSNTVVGRLLFPWENKPVRLVVLVAVLLFVIYNRKSISKRIMFFEGFLLFSVVAFFSTYALGRASFGIGQAMATRYAYLPTFFLVMGCLVLVSRFKNQLFENLMFLLGIYCLAGGLVVFNWRVTEWTKRPQQTRQYFTLIKQSKTENCYVDELLPKFINPEPTKRLSDLIFPLKTSLRFGTEKQNCVLLTQ